MLSQLFRVQQCWGALLLALIWSPLAHSAGSSLVDLELEALMDLEVTSVSKRVQPLSDSPAAVYVITSQEIKRSGVTSLPDALRLAPGVEVARLNRSTWAISIRGFNSMYSSHLLVLIDGRSIYSPLYGGVYWDLVMPMLEDIDRIEVIRGPGASVWGVNAMNGVINIITKSPELTQGTRVVTATGNEESNVRIRHGDKHENLFYRGYAVYRDGESNTSFDTGKDANDDAKGSQVGFRADWLLNNEKVILQSDLSSIDKSYNHTISDLVGTTDNHFNNTSFNVLAKWIKPLGNNEFHLQGSYDYIERDEPGYLYDIHTADIDFQFNHDWRSNHRITWGINYRHYWDDIEGSDFINLSNESSSWDLYSFFVQDEININEKLTLVAGIKADKVDDIDIAWQPTLRFNVNQSEAFSYWGSLSRPVRISTRVERYGTGSNEFPEHTREYAATLARVALVNEDVLTEGLEALSFEEFLELLAILTNTSTTEDPTLIAHVEGSKDLDSVEAMVYELGFRWQPREDIFWDVATFHFDYDNIRALDLTHWEATENSLEAYFQSLDIANVRSYGLEAAMEYRPKDDLLIKFNYNYINTVVEGDNAVSAAEFLKGVVPKNKFSFRTYFDLSDDYTLDTDFYYVGKITTAEEGNSPEEYVDLNLRLAWKATPHGTVSFVLMNLFHDHRYEYQETNIGPARTEIDRSIYLQLEWKQ